MYKQHSKGTSCHSVDCPAVFYLDRLKHHKQGQSKEEGQKFVGVCQKIVRAVIVPGLGKVEDKEDDRADGQKQKNKRKDNPSTEGVFWQKSVFSDIGGCKVKDREPDRIVRGDFKKRYRGQKRIDGKQQKNKTSVHLFFKIANKDIEKRHKAKKHKIAAHKVVV